MLVLLGATSMAWGQAFRPIPMPRLPGGGGSHFFHLLIHRLGGDDIGMYCALGIAILVVIAIGWSLGYA